MRTSPGSRASAPRHAWGTAARWILLIAVVITAVALVGYNVSMLVTNAGERVLRGHPMEQGGFASSGGAEAGTPVWQLPEKRWDVLPEARPTNRNEEALQASALYDMQIPELNGCPEPRSVSTFEEFQQDVSAQWNCLHQAWKPVLKHLGADTAQPALSFFRDRGTDSDCGHLEAPAFYCPLDGGAGHFGFGHFEMAQQWRLSVNEMVNHEYGHHLQSAVGITEAHMAEGSDEDSGRRSELQAICWSAMMTWHNSAVSWDMETYDSWRWRIDSMVADAGHGSQESLRYWGLRGLYARSPGDCNTWVAHADAVG